MKQLINRLICLFKKDKRYKVLTCKQTCFQHPSEWDVYTRDNEHIYIRYNYGILEVTVTPYGKEPKVLLVIEYGNSFDGELSSEELRKLTKHIIKWKNCVYKR